MFSILSELIVNQVHVKLFQTHENNDNFLTSNIYDHLQQLAIRDFDAQFKF